MNNLKTIKEVKDVKDIEEILNREKEEFQGLQKAIAQVKEMIGIYEKKGQELVALLNKQQGKLEVLEELLGEGEEDGKQEE